MGIPKQRQCAKLGNCNTSTGFINAPESDPDLDLDGENGWVIVKKQRVTILVPSLPVADKSTRPYSEPRQSEVLPIKMVDNTLEFPPETCPNILPVSEREMSIPVAPKKDLQLPKKAAYVQTLPPLTKLPRQVPRMASINPNRVRTSKSHNLLGVSKTSRMIARPISVQSQSGFPGIGSPLNQSLRALNLERKLQRAGGLSPWLVSLGLEQFARLFQRKGLGKFHLVNLTMKKLKDMGANAVGPRRKLIHAIDCICQPYCFQAL